MVVYRKEATNRDPALTGNTAAPLVEEVTHEAVAPTTHMVPRAILTSRPNSYPFQERHLVLDQPIKVGRSVARCQQALCNAIFSCKVLSRNHALLWYENGKFYLQDTKSSNGTFVNNQRLSKSSEESAPREVCSGDIVQFGVDVVENCKKVVHGCIVATLKLYLPDGKEAKASPTTSVVPETSISSKELYQLSQFLQEALHREQILENKLGILQKLVSNTQDESDIGWKALIEEDRLLSRIETLESQLQTCGKSVSEEKLKDDVVKLQDDKDKYQSAAKESLKKLLQEKLDAIRKVQDLENSLSNTENECSHLLDVNQKKEQEIQILLEKISENEKELIDLNTKLQELEIKYQDLMSQNVEEKLLQENNVEEMRKEEQLLSTKIEALKAENDFANEQLSAMKAHFDVLKKEHTLQGTIEKNGNLASHDEMNSSSENTEKQLIQVLSCEVNRLEAELQRIQKENIKNDTLIYSDNDDITSNDDDLKSPDYVNKLQADVNHFKKILNETCESKKIVDSELLQAKTQVEELQCNNKSMKSELTSFLNQLSKAKSDLKAKNCKLDALKEKLLSVSHENDPMIQKTLIQECLDEFSSMPSLYLEDTSIKENGYISKSEYDDLKNDCAMYKEKIKVLEQDLMNNMFQYTRLEVQTKYLMESSQRETTDGSGFSSIPSDLTTTDQIDSDENTKKLLDAQEMIVLVTERYEECNKEKSYLLGELSSLKDQLQLLSIQSKTVSICSVVPLIVLAIAMMLAFYPTLAHLTATSDQV